MSIRGLQSCSLMLVAAVGLTCVFWLPLWLGGGFIGGDVYSYYFPQKVFFAERLHAGEFPLWNNRTGFGYPLVGESQTGAFYPFHLFWYYFFDVNTAYNAEHLLHYVLAFMFTAVYSRRAGFSLVPSLLAATVYTYAWFPSRCCVEWAILGGAWLPAALWCVEGFLQTRLWRWAFGVSGVLAMQMLAGHFQIAFITQLLLAAYVPLRLWCGRVQSPESRVQSQKRDSMNQGADAPRSPDTPHSSLSTHHTPLPTRHSPLATLLAAVVFAFALATVQLFPTWELKQHSQRNRPGAHHELAFGAVPAWYWSQIVRPWHWYSPLVDRNEALRNSPLAAGARTHEIEAHLYFGLLPLVLAAWGIVRALVHRDRLLLTWLLLGAAALCYTPGWMLPITRHLPGFNFFQGPGRFGIVTTLAVALLAASALERILARPTVALRDGIVVAVGIVAAAISIIWLAGDVAFAIKEYGAANPLIFGRSAAGEGLIMACLSVWIAAALIGVVLACSPGSARAQMTARNSPLHPSPGGRGALPLPSHQPFSQSERGYPSRTAVGKLLLGCAVFALSVTDLWMVSRLVTSSVMIQDPPINHLADSPVRRTLKDYENETGKLARLFAPGPNFPNVLGVSSLPVYLTFGPREYPAIVEPELERTEAEGTDGPLSASRLKLCADWGVTHVLTFEPLASESAPIRDGILDPVWNGFDPVLNRAWARGQQPLFLYAMRLSPDRVRDVAQNAANKSLLIVFQNVAIERREPTVFAELMSPGWTVTVNGQPAVPITVEGLFRGVDLPQEPGEYTVVWKYEPRFLYWGAAVSIAAFVLLAAIAHLRYWHPALVQRRGGDR